MRNQALDILRGIAILLVLGYHYDYFHLWARCGWAGVDLFFVLSGFLISGLLFGEYKKRGSIDLMRFWIRRGFKIYPAFYVLIAVTVIWLAANGAASYSGVLVDSFFLRSYARGYWDHTWTLAVEEQFYILLPLLLVLLVRLGRGKTDPFKAVVPIAIGAAWMCLILRFLAFHGGIPSESVTYRTHLRLDSLLCGVALGYVYHFSPDALARIRRLPLPLIGSALVAPAFVFNRGSGVICTVGFTMIFAGSACFLVRALDWPTYRHLPARSLVALGRYSYSIYLWHPVLAWWVFRTIRPTLLSFSFYLVGSIALGVVLGKLIEMPALTLRDRLLPKRQAAPVPTAARAG